jgi:hypothetical protein
VYEHKVGGRIVCLGPMVRNFGDLHEDMGDNENKWNKQEIIGLNIVKVK